MVLEGEEDRREINEESKKEKEIISMKLEVAFCVGLRPPILFA